MSTSAPAERKWFGHPRGLSTLFYTEMWERLSYYGMRGLLLLFLVAQIEKGGFGLTDKVASAIYGLYVSFVYLFALPGGWVADRILGQRRAVFVGGCFIAAGHFSMAIPTATSFYLGLCLIIIGTGLLKPNVSAMVGDLYPEGGSRRDAGFSIYYSGINLGAFIGPFICGYLGEKINWHWGFGAAGIGMVLGLIQYSLGGKYLGNAGQRVIGPKGDDKPRAIRTLVIGVLLILGTIGVLWALKVDIVKVAQWAGLFMLALGVLYFASVIFFGGLAPAEKRRVAAIFIFFLAAVLFWAGYEQAGSSLNLFAERLTNRVLLGWEMPASFLQSVNPAFIILFSPIVGILWVRMRSRVPSTPAKMGYGLVIMALGFLLLAWGATYAVNGVKVSPMWLVGAYFLHTIGELCLSPVGLSSVTKLSPRRLVGQMMGTWFMGTALGNLIAGLAGGGFAGMSTSELFRSVGWITGGAGLLLLLFTPLIVRKLIGVENPVAVAAEPAPLPGVPDAAGGRVTVLSKKWLLPESEQKK
jgi:POT family proton-dependent oligopeptide transporter